MTSLLSLHFSFEISAFSLLLNQYFYFFSLLEFSFTRTAAACNCFPQDYPNTTFKATASNNKQNSTATPHIRSETTSLRNFSAPTYLLWLHLNALLCPACHAALATGIRKARSLHSTQHLKPLAFATPCTHIACANTVNCRVPYFQTSTLSHACHAKCNLFYWATLLSLNYSPYNYSFISYYLLLTLPLCRQIVICLFFTRTLDWAVEFVTQLPYQQHNVQIQNYKHVLQVHFYDEHGACRFDLARVDSILASACGFDPLFACGFEPPPSPRLKMFQKCLLEARSRHRQSVARARALGGGWLNRFVKGFCCVTGWWSGVVGY